MIVNLVFTHLGFLSGNLFLIAPFPDRCLLVPFHCFRVSFADKYEGVSKSSRKRADIFLFCKSAELN